MSGQPDQPIDHIPVLAETLRRRLVLPVDGVMIDATLGRGGHSRLLARQLGPAGILVGVDVDADSLDVARSRLSDLPCRQFFVRANFAELHEVLPRLGLTTADLILADLGYSSAQLEDPAFGMSFREDMPLDMRIDRSLKTTAADIVNGADEKTLADLIFEYGEDRASRRIARFIVEERRREPIRTTGRLAAVVARATTRPGDRRTWRIHPATRTFQALRIAVNHELDNLHRLLDDGPELLGPGGRLAVISFHSLEDRLVKWAFKRAAQQGRLTVETKKPLTASEAEVAENRRSRSAKLRIARRPQPPCDADVSVPQGVVS